nr:tripartite motif-containing protein 5-like isoform X1 [Loxodonta africana]XP_023396371.1 tripartite motif-containing protein 5-like isoform X1 [Loxodonta africana]XP_023396372.1 tripartite motif-containing protein 5-like isoform X1 [Loxodonta africana]XP_023396373.1 tripartite motif-containing protein 5-like isoform X1 [Loxodonta africana]XP_023396374.1 tripartite motif-containing protein 5-like isoform X1 [Loxodonta africana]
MASKILVNLEEGATCPICLELLMEPISLDCGHSFCQACITADNKKSMVSQEKESSCPVCRIKYQPGNLRSNQHLASMVERLKEVKMSLEKEEKENYCVHHGEKLRLFCKLDGKFICWLCERSQEHHGHPTFLVEEVVPEYQKNLQAAFESLSKEQKKAEKWKADLREERDSWKKYIQTERQSVRENFSQLRSILDNEEQKELEELKSEEESVMQNLSEAENELGQQSDDVKKLMSDLQHRLQGTTMEMLQVRLGREPLYFRFEKIKTKCLLFCVTELFLVVTLKFIWSYGTSSQHVFQRL